MSVSEAQVQALLNSYRHDGRAQHVNRRFLPSRDESIAILSLCLEVLYPGYFGPQHLTEETIDGHVRVTLERLEAKLAGQIEQCLCYREQEEQQEAARVVPSDCRKRGQDLAAEFLTGLPEVRRRLILDAQAALDGDPAASNLDEIILAYPGFLAVTVYRVAHELYRLGVPMMPRIMTEWAHSHTGVDIHPGATVGDSFFIDHGTGVVVGQTTRLGDRVRLYQGVTLGALSLPRDAHGRVDPLAQRHPTVEDDVIIFANATVLGGHTVIGRGSLLGGSVFLTRSIPPEHRVSMEPPRLRVLTRPRGSGPNGEFLQGDVDFDI